MTTLTTKYQRLCTTGYTRPVTDHDGAAAGGVIHTEARRLATGLVRIRRTASTGSGLECSATEDVSDEEFQCRFAGVDR